MNTQTTIKKLDIQEATKSLNALASGITGKDVRFNLSERPDGKIAAESNDLNSYIGLPLFKKLVISTFRAASYQKATDDFRFELYYTADYLNGEPTCNNFLSASITEDGKIKKFLMAFSDNDVVHGSSEFNRIMNESIDFDDLHTSILASLKANGINERDINDNNEYIDICSYHDSELAPSTDKYKDLTVSISLSIAIEDRRIYATATLNCEDMGNECDAFVSNALKAEVAEKVANDAAKVQKLLADNNIFLTLSEEELPAWTDSPNQEDEEVDQRMA